MAHWIDNADSYICSCCGHEVNNPNKTRYGAGRCPRCFAEMDYNQSKEPKTKVNEHKE